MKKRKFSTGAVRDVVDEKLRFNMYNSPLVEYRFAKYMLANAKKYGEGNWKKGIPKEVYLESLLRHVMALWLKEECGIDDGTSSDHASGVRFNIDGFMQEEEVEKLKNQS